VLPAAVWPSCARPLDGRSPDRGRPSRHSSTGSSGGEKLFVNHLYISTMLNLKPLSVFHLKYCYKIWLAS